MTMRTDHRTEPLHELDLYELALLGGGPHLVITSALTRLHRDGLLRIRRREGTVKVSGELEPAAAPIERAIFEAVRRQPGISTEALRSELKDDDALVSISTRLTQAGLLPDEAQATRMRRLWWRVRRRPLTTSRGRDVLHRHRAQHEDLRHHPMVDESALTVALFGGGALWLADPAVASALGVPREERSRDGLWGPGRGTGCGGGGNCAGGGCGGGGGGGGGGGCGGGGGG